MTKSSTNQRSSADLDASLTLVEVKPGIKFSQQILRDMLPDAETALFFGKVYDLDYQQVSALLWTVLKSDVATALSEGDHSTELQDYIVDELIDEVPDMEIGDVSFASEPIPDGEILPEVWKMLEVTIAQAIKDVAAKLESVVHKLPGKQGSMVMKSMMVMNRNRPTIGDHKATIHHAPQAQNLVILDVSGSMTEATIRKIVDDVVALSYMADAGLAIVSNTTTYWEPGGYATQSVLDVAEYGGTHYETLADLMNRDWGTVVTVADYDSSASAKQHLRRNCIGHIERVIDISLVNRPTFLGECVGQLADKVEPVLVGCKTQTEHMYGNGLQ